MQTRKEAKNQFLYRLVTEAEWQIAQVSQKVPLSAFDRRSGFVHLSTLEQGLETARLYFSSPLLALEIEANRLGEDLKWEKVPAREGQNMML